MPREGPPARPGGVVKGKAGRPTKLTPEAQEKLLGALKAGNFREVAAAYAGIGVRTMKQWMAAGKSNPSGPYGEFRTQVIAAERGAEIVHVGRIAQAAQRGDWKASAWWLERKAAERWARQDRAASAGRPQDELSKLSDEELLARVRELMAAEAKPHGGLQ